MLLLLLLLLLLLHVLLQSLVDSMPTHAGVPRLMLQSPRNQTKEVKGVVHGDLATPRGSDLPLSHLFPAQVDTKLKDEDLSDPDILDICDMCQKHASTNRRKRPGVATPHWPQMMVSNGCRSARGVCKYVRSSQSMQYMLLDEHPMLDYIKYLVSTFLVYIGRVL